eukprot:14753043-Alexandrium_andersonii.AAC.1
MWGKNSLPWDDELCLYLHPADAWWDAAARDENQKRNCRVPTGRFRGRQRHKAKGPKASGA